MHSSIPNKPSCYINLIIALNLYQRELDCITFIDVKKVNFSKITRNVVNDDKIEQFCIVKLEIGIVERRNSETHLICNASRCGVINPRNAENHIRLKNHKFLLLFYFFVFEMQQMMTFFE